MKKFIAALLVALFVSPALAEDVTLTWTNPTDTFTMTAAGPYTNAAGSKIYMEVADTADPNSETAVLPNMKPGTYNFVAVSYDDQGVASPVSGESTKVVTEWVVANIVVKIVSKTPSGFLLLGVGTIPLGTACDLTQEVNGHYVVPQDTVIWSDPARNAGTAPLPLVVVAQCG